MFSRLPAPKCGFRSAQIPIQLCEQVTTTIKHGLNGASDAQQLEFARVQGRVLVTCDNAFIALANSGVPHVGIVFWTVRHRPLGQVVLDLVLLSRVATAEEMVGHIEFL